MNKTKTLLHAFALATLGVNGADAHAAGTDFQTEIKRIAAEIRADYDASATNLNQIWDRLSKDYECGPPSRYGTECKAAPGAIVDGIHRRIRVGSPVGQRFVIDEITIRASHSAGVDVPALMRDAFKEWQASSSMTEHGPLPCGFAYQLPKASDAKTPYQLKMLFPTRPLDCAAPVNEVTFALVLNP